MLKRMEEQPRMSHETNNEGVNCGNFPPLCFESSSSDDSATYLRCRCSLLEFPSTSADMKTHNTCHHSDCCDEYVISHRESMQYVESILSNSMDADGTLSNAKIW